jgi:membrane protein DedA with SNARE-associated domain
VLDSLIDALSGSSWTYALIAAIVAGDAVLPLLPGETAVLTGAILAHDGDLAIALVVLVSAGGALLGDATSYLLGRVFGDRAVRRLARGERARGRVTWAREQLRRRGTGVVIAARFIPGGRTATTLAAGTLQMPWQRFLAADAVGASLWSCYAAALGWFGGRAFSDSFWKPLALALAIGAAFGAIAELLRRLHEHRTHAGQS